MENSDVPRFPPVPLPEAVLVSASPSASAPADPPTVASGGPPPVTPTPGGETDTARPARADDTATGRPAHASDAPAGRPAHAGDTGTGQPPRTDGTAAGRPAHADDTESRRLAALRRYEILDAPSDGTFDEIAKLAATVFEAPIATVSVVDVDRVWFAATHGLDGVAEVGVEPGLCVSAVLADGPYVVEDAGADPRTLDHPLVRGELGLRFYAAAPIVTAGGHRLGTVNVIDRRPREVTATQTAVLTGLAALVARHLDLRLATIHAIRAERLLREEADDRGTVTAALAERLRQVASEERETGHPALCQLGGSGRQCAEPAELKIADGWGDSAWACTTHAEEALFVAAVFIANKDLGGLNAYLDRP
ncbi:GAF domain-containing protein [Streptosporangium sp. NPDC002524]|uniref:GAF domain-containing protein n=1 Tax=Streptosporangium sp. NPDC002524 TaxID=3154537 RepID=UPI00331E12D2